MSNSYMKSAHFQTQVNQANQIKECYPCGTQCSQIINYYLPTDLTIGDLTVTGAFEVNNTSTADIITSSMLVDANLLTLSTNILDINASTINFSTLPTVTQSTVTQSNELIPRSYVDNLINIALPAIAGYGVSTCYTVPKWVGKGGANLTSVSGDGNIYFLYPFVNTTVSKIITYTNTANSTTNATIAGMSLLEYSSLNATSGICVATTGNVGPTLWRIGATRYATPLTTSYTLQAGKKYGITTIHNNTTTVQLLGMGMGLATYSIGTFPYDIQTSATYTGGIPTVGSVITYNPSGSGFAIVAGLEP